jgi:putative oxidoreductase
MTIASTVARILLGLVFLAAGVSGFLLIANPPPAPPGLAGAFQDVFFKSHWVLFVDAVEALAGALLLANRYVPLAVAMLAAVLYNIFAFHITMAPGTIAVPLVVAALWALVAVRHRASFAPLFVQKAQAAPAPTSTLERERSALAHAA